MAQLIRDEQVVRFGRQRRSRVTARSPRPGKRPGQRGAPKFQGQSLRQRPWSAGRLGLCRNSRSGSPEASWPPGSRARGRRALYKGIAERTFERSFQLADHVVVKGASLANGLLHVDLVREIPEAMKPRAIPIASSDKVLNVQPTKVAA